MIPQRRFYIITLILAISSISFLILYLNAAQAGKKKDALLGELRTTNEAKLVDARKLVPSLDSLGSSLGKVIGDSSRLSDPNSIDYLIEYRFEVVKHGLAGMVRGMRYDSILFSENIDMKKSIETK